MTVSVVTAVYNRAAVLPRCIASVAAQGPGVEHIIIDGGSTDGTVDVIRRHERSLGAWVSGPDRGVYDAWNKALALARGEWIAFLGADDAYCPGAVRRYLETAAENPAAEYISSRVELVFPAVYSRIIGRPWTWAEFRRHMCVAHVGSFHRASLFRRLGPYDVRYRIVGDYELLLRAGAGLSAAFLEAVTARYGRGRTQRFHCGARGGASRQAGARRQDACGRAAGSCGSVRQTPLPSPDLAALDESLMGAPKQYLLASTVAGLFSSAAILRLSSMDVQLWYGLMAINLLLFVWLGAIRVRSGIWQLTAVLLASGAVGYFQGTGSGPLFAKQFLGITFTAFYFSCYYALAGDDAVSCFRHYIRAAYYMSIGGILLMLVQIPFVDEAPRLQGVLAEPAMFALVTLPAAYYCFDRYRRCRTHGKELAVIVAALLLSRSSVGFLGMLFGVAVYFARPWTRAACGAVCIVAVGAGLLRLDRIPHTLR